MKKKTLSIIFEIFAMLCLCFSFAGCSNNDDSVDKIPEGTGNKVLVAYFSATNTTKGVAEKIAVSTGGTLYRITPMQPYTSADLNYNTDCRANREQNDPTARPEISGSIENMSEYDLVFLGYPIWWAEAPKIIFTFLESYDFTGKTIIPFCTSGGSGVGNSAKNLHSSASSATWLDGTKLSGSASQSSIDSYIMELGFNKE